MDFRSNFLGFCFFLRGEGRETPQGPKNLALVFFVSGFSLVSAFSKSPGTCLFRFCLKQGFGIAPLGLGARPLGSRLSFFHTGWLLFAEDPPKKAQDISMSCYFFPTLGVGLLDLNSTILLAPNSSPRPVYSSLLECPTPKCPLSAQL